MSVVSSTFKCISPIYELSTDCLFCSTCETLGMRLPPLRQGCELYSLHTPHCTMFAMSCSEINTSSFGHNCILHIIVIFVWNLHQWIHFTQTWLHGGDWTSPVVSSYCICTVLNGVSVTPSVTSALCRQKHSGILRSKMYHMFPSPPCRHTWTRGTAFHDTKGFTEHGDCLPLPSLLTHTPNKHNMVPLIEMAISVLRQWMWWHINRRWNMFLTRPRTKHKRATSRHSTAPSGEKAVPSNIAKAVWNTLFVGVTGMLSSKWPGNLNSKCMWNTQLLIALCSHCTKNPLAKRLA